MPINKFNGYYYGVGLKLDEKSVNDFSKQLENKLNKTVANVTKEITSLQEAFKLGENADLSPLISSLNAAVNGIKGVNDADFNVLKAQVEDMDNKFKGLTQTVEKLGVDLTDVSQKFELVVGNLTTKIDGFLSQPSTMRDSLKRDLRAMQDMAKYYSEALKLDPNTKSTGLEAYFAEFKNQFGNISELSDIATQEIAQDFLRLGDLLRKSGLPIEGIRSDLLQMTNQLENAFKLKNPASVGKVFESAGYQIDTYEANLADVQKKMQDMEKEAERLNSLLDKSGKAKFNGGTIAKQDQILNLEEKMEKIKQYNAELNNLDPGSVKWVEAFKKQISLIRNVEKELESVGNPNEALNAKWEGLHNLFSGYEGETLGAKALSSFSEQIGWEVQDIATQRQKLDVESKKLTQSIAELAGTQQKLNDVRTKKQNKSEVEHKMQKAYILDLRQDVELQAKVNEEQWRTAINASISKISEKITPVGIKAQLKNADAVKNEIQKLKNAQLLTDGVKTTGPNAGDNKDTETFNKRFKALLDELKAKKSELKTALNDWHKEFDKMFQFQFKVNGLKKDEFGDLSKVISDLVDNINATLEDKPLKFTSNIQELVANINEQLQNIKIDNLQVGGISAGSIGTNGINSTGGTTMLPMQVIPIINDSGKAAQQAAEGFKQAGQAAENAGQKAQSKTEQIVRTGEKQVEALLEAYGNLTDAQRTRIAKKSPDFAKAITDLEKNPTWDNYQKNILRFGDLSKIISQIRPHDGLQKFIDKIQADILEYDKLDDAGKAAASRSNNYVQSVVEEYFKQIAKNGKPNQALASDKNLLDIFTQLKANPTYENYKKLLLNNTKVFADVESSRPTSKVQDFINLLVADQKAYEAAFGKPIVESASVQQNRQWFENGQQIVQYIIQLAEMAAKIQPLRSKSGIEITNDLFGDSEFSKWIAGRQVSKADIGTIIGKKNVTDNDINKFLSDMNMTKANLVDKTDPYTAQYLNPLLSAIQNFKDKQEMLDKALAQLQSGKPTKNMQKFIEGFGSTESKEAYLTDNLKWLQTITKKGATTDAQKYIVDTFKKNNVDISGLKSAKTQADQWQIIQDNILNNPLVDFNKLMGDLRAGKNQFNSSYKDFVEIIGIAKRFVTSSNALADIGKTANAIVEGKKETITKRDGTTKTVKVNGLRGELNKYGVVITGKNGDSFGYREGKATVENGIFGSHSPFSQIAKELTAALQNAIEIAFSKNKVDGLDVKRYNPNLSEPKSTYGNDLYFNRDIAKQRTDYYQSEINKLNARLQAQENNYKKFSTSDGLREKLNKNSRYVELEQKFNNKTATNDEKLELNKIIENAKNELTEQTKRLAESIQKTKTDLADLTTKLNQSKKDYQTYNSQIKKQEKEFKNGAYQQAQIPKQQHSSGYSNQPTSSGNAGLYAPVGTSGGVAVIGGSTDIATESTLRAIYNALVGNKGSDNPQLNTRIATLEKTIAEIENVAKQQKVNQKKQTNAKVTKKTHEETKQQKVTSPTKKPSEGNTQAELQKIAQQLIAEKKALQSGLEATKKQLEEAKKQEALKEKQKVTEATKIKQEAANKQQEIVKQGANAETKIKQDAANKQQEVVKQGVSAEEKTKQNSHTKSFQAALQKQQTKIDPIKQSIGKSEKELFAASNKYLEEVNSFMQIFREHQFALRDGKVAAVKSGLLMQVGGIPDNYAADTRGHMHPNNSMYSGTDIKNIARRKEANKQYNKDLLITPDNVFSISGLQKMDPSSIKDLGAELETLENSLRRLNLSGDSFRKFETALKFTAFSNSGVDFKAYSKNADGSLSDITSTFSKVSDTLYKNFIKIGHADLSKGLPAETIKAIKESNEFKTIDDGKYVSGNQLPSSLNGIISVIQNALDNKRDLTPLNSVKGSQGTVFEILMRDLEKLENFIAKDSPYYTIKSKFKSNGNDANFMNEIRPLLEQFFKVGDNKDRDERADGIYKTVYGVSNAQDKSVDQEVDVNSSLAELKTELAFLKSIQSGSGVRFATQDKQDQIISILQGGIKVQGINGKDIKDTSGDKEKKQEKNLSTAEQAKQAQQAINTMSKEANIKIDSTGKQTIHTIQKIGAETAKVTQVTESGVTKSTLELSNKYEMAMQSLFQKIRGDSGKYLFGAETVRFGVDTTEAQDTLLKYVDTYRQLEDAMAQYKKSGDILLTDGPNKGKQLQTVIDDLQVQLGQYEQRLVSISNASETFLGGKAPFAMLDGNQIKNSAYNLKLLASNTEQCAIAFNGVYNNGHKLVYDVLQDGAIKRYALEVDAATGNVRRMEQSETSLVNALQNVNKVAKQNKELNGILSTDGVNQDATIIQNYKKNLQDMHAYIDKVWNAARENGGLIPLDEQDRIYAMSQEVLRLGSTIQREYKRIATIRDSGAPFEALGQVSGVEAIETKMRQYLNRFAEGQALQVSDLKYDSVTQSMTADLVDLSGTITKVKLQYNDLLNSINVSSAISTNSIDDMASKMNAIGSNIDQALGAGVINKNMAEYQAYANEVAKLDTLITNIENGTIAYNHEAIQQWNAQRQAIIDTGKALSEIAQTNAKKSLPGVRAVESQSNKKIQIDNMIETLPGAENNSQYQSYINAYNKLLELRDRFKNEGTLGLESNQKQLQIEADKVNQLANAMSQLAQQSTKIRSSAANEDILKLPNSFDIQTLEVAMKKFAGVSANATKEQWMFNNATNSASYTIKGANNVVSEMSITYDSLTHSLVRTTKQQYQVKTAMQEFVGSVGNKFKELGRYLLSFGSFYRIWGIIRQGVTYVRDIDSALTELKKVTDETDRSYDRFLQDMSKTGSVIGATVSDLTKMAAEWARLGYSMDEAGKLAESTAILLNVSEFDDATQASEALISTMQAFQYTADESQHVVDILNEVGNNYAVSSDGIATALQDSASALMEAGNNLEQSVALVAAANKVVQDPNSVGSALRTISLRLRGTSVSVLEEMGEETDGVVESVSKMQEKIEALTGVNILTNSGAYKDTYTIIKEIGTVWEDMSDIDQAALLELMAGKNRANTLAAILGNMKDLEGAYQSAFDAEGSALKENAAYLDSIQGKIDLFNNSVQTMWMNFINSDVVKFIVDIGTNLMNVIDTVGVLNTALIGAFGGTFLKNQLKKNNISMFDAIFKTIPSKIKTGATSILDAQLGGQANKQVGKLIASNVTDYTKYALAIKNVSAVKQAEILINNSLSESEQIAILTRNLGSEAAAKQAIANAQLATSHNTVAIATVEDLVNTGALTAQQGAAALATIGFVTAEGESVVVTKAEALEKLNNAVATRVLEAADRDAIVTALGLSGSNVVATGTFTALAKSIWGAVAALGKFLLLTPAGWATLAVSAIIGAIAAYNKFGPTHENYIEKLKEETDSLKSVQSELQSVQSELETTGNRIDELNEKGTLSFVEEEELNRLKKVSEELERQEKILLAKEERARNKQINTALKAIKTDENFKETTNYVLSSTSPNAQSDLSSTTSVPILSNTTETTNKFESTLNSLKRAKEDLEKAEAELSSTGYKAESKEYKKLEKQVELAQNRVDSYNESIDSMSATWQTEYGEIGYIENATTEVERQWNDFYRQYQGYLDQQALLNDDYGKSTVLDRIFGATGTDIAQNFKKKFENAVKRGRNPAEVIESLLANGDYSNAFSGLEEQFGITLDNIKAYFTQTGEFAVDPEFDITKYTKAISSHSAVISEYQEAIASLEKGSFTMDDFMSLIEKYPDLAKGVDISSNAFYGLSRNLKRAIKSNTKDFVDDLQDLKKSLIAAGKSTESIDQLIEAVEKMPTDALDDTIAKYGTLADEITSAKVAQDRLLASMEENPNGGYETRGDAMDYMKQALQQGEIGSESNVWNVAKEYGFTYDSAQSINENADALAKFIAVRETWYKKNDDDDSRTEDGYSFEGTKNFIEAVEKVVKDSEEAKTRLSEILEWDYDEDTGVFNFDFDNENLEEIISLLGEAQELMGLTSEEWMDMMVQIGQYYEMDWSSYEDALDYLDKIASGSSDATTKLKEYGQAMQEYFGGGTKVDLTDRPVVGKEEMQAAGWNDYADDYSTVYSHASSNADGTVTVTTTPILPDGKILSPSALEYYTSKIAEGADPATYEFIVDGQKYTGDDIVLAKHVGEDSIAQANAYAEALHKAQEQYQLLQDPLEIQTTIAKEGLEGLNQIFDLQGSIQTNSQGITIIDTDAFTSALEAAGYTKQQIDNLITKIKEYQNVCAITNNDPLGLNNFDASLNTVMSSLDYLGVQWELTKGTLETPAEINITSNDLITTLQAKGWTKQQITAYLQTLTSAEDGLGITIDGKVTMNKDEIDEAIAAANRVPETEKTDYTVTGTGVNTLNNIISNWKTATAPKTTDYTINETTVKKTVTQSSSSGILGKLFGGNNVDGTAHSQGTAYNSGSWGAQQTETSLVGELGPELLVRGNRWTTVGENGAEFTQVKKGDIIFNHKQTESLLKNGYVTGRGKAYASGTAFASGGGTFGRYEFSGEGGYTKYDVNDKVVDKFGNAASDLSGAADDLSDSTEVIDWVEIRLEEINEQLELLNSQMENAVGYIAKNQIIDVTLDVNNNKLSNLKAGMAEYERYAEQLLAKVPTEYQDSVKNGAISITEFTGEANEETVEAINNYREWAQKVADLRQQIEDLESEIVELAKTKFDNVSEEYDNIVSLIENANEKLDAQVSLMEDRGYVASKQYYESMMVNTKQIQSELKKEKEVLQSVLDEQVRLGNIKVGSDAWYEMIDQLYEVDASIVECTSDLESYQNAINDIYWDNFDELINRIDYLKDETQSLIDLMDSDDLVVTPETEDGWSSSEVKWTDEGIASLGLYAQQMEIAEYKSKQYAKAIDDLNSDYAASKYSESEYLEKLNELTSAQYDSIEAYYDAQDAIKDLNKARVDEIKNGIEKQIDAYEKLIDKKKEALDAEKDLYDFQRSIEESNKEISDIERQIAALSSDNSASARAKRAKLQAELAQAQQDLQDKYYDRSVEDQKEALDKELENFKEEKDKEVEKWEEYLEDVEKVLTDSLSLVKDSASEIYDTLHSKADEYNLTLSDSIVSPWESGSLAISDYQSVFDTAMSSTMDQLSSLKAEWQSIIDLMAKAAGEEITSQKKENNSYTAATSNQGHTSTSSTSYTTTTVAKPTIKVGGKINAGNARIYNSANATSGYKQYYSDDPIYKVLAIDGDWIQVRHHKLTTGVTGWFKKGHVNAYAKGTKGVKENQLALIDELGDELVMHADGSGKLAFLSKGSAVIPHDISENLMQLGKLNPQDVLDRNRPVVNAPHITNNNIELNVSFGEVVHIDHVDNNAVPNLAKTVEKQIEKYMKGLNAEIRKFTR